MSGTVANKATEKQGIVSILGSDCEQSKAATAASLRRTLSADMSSKKWLAQNGFYPMKNISSSEQLDAISVAESSSSSEEEEELDQRPGQDEVWRSIQSQKEELAAIKPNNKSSQFDTWSSILSHKENKDSSDLPPPYIHPPVKRSPSSLSEKSLEICTESLGSETGSDGFSSYASSETGDTEEEREPQPQQQLSQSLDHGEELQVVKYNNLYPTTSKRTSSSTKSFPPPLPFLPRCDGPSLHMQSHRNNGRLILEAVSVPSQNYFHAQRQDGRLVLTFSGSCSDDCQETADRRKVDGVEEIDEVFETSEDEKDNEAEGQEEEEDEDEKEEEEEMEEKLDGYSTNRHGAKQIGIVMKKLMMKKLVGIDKNFNKAVNLVKGGANPVLPPQSLPRPPRIARLIPSPPAPAAAATFNTYEYLWRSKQPTVTALTSRSNSNKVIVSSNNYYSSNNKKNKKLEVEDEQEEEEGDELVLLRGNKGDYLVPLLKGCKEPRRSLFIWELPYNCIATS